MLMALTDNIVALVEAAYQLQIVTPPAIRSKLEHDGKCALHVDIQATSRCRFCYSLMCEHDCKLTHESMCTRGKLVPVCYRANFDIAVFSAKLAAIYPISPHNPFGDTVQLQRAFLAADGILRSMM